MAATAVNCPKDLRWRVKCHRSFPGIFHKELVMDLRLGHTTQDSSSGQAGDVVAEYVSCSSDWPS